VLIISLFCVGCQPRNDDLPTEPARATAESPRDVKLVEAEVNNFCGACHPTPHPAEFPRDEWRAEVQQGFDFYMQSPIAGVQVPPLANIVAYYEAHASDTLPQIKEVGNVDSELLTFDQTPSLIGDQTPAIAHLRWCSSRSDRTNRLIACDMRSGLINEWQIRPDDLTSSPLAKIQNPSHAEVVDFGEPSRGNLVVADLGSFPPADHDRGMVVLLTESIDGGEFTSQVAQKGLGRVSDVQPGDLDGDGDADLVVAAFGWRRSGQLLWLENHSPEKQPPSFEPHQLDQRHGALFAPLVDLNNDGLLDVVAVFGQEYESVDAYYNLGDGKFRKEQLFHADTPTFGMCGIEIVDLDLDDDKDIVFINGDMFDDYHLRPYHAIHWLENIGQKWRHHEVHRMPGVARTKSIDIDEDGDLDILACALIPHQVIERHPELQLASVVCLEQTAKGEFKPRILEVNQCHHAALEAADFDSDGDIDIAVGNYRSNPAVKLPDLTIWWNQKTE